MSPLSPAHNPTDRDLSKTAERLARIEAAGLLHLSSVQRDFAPALTDPEVITRMKALRAQRQEAA